MPAPTRRPAPRPALSRERIEYEALVLVERDGLEALSMRRLAQALGCEAMSLYHHFPSKAHVLDALVDRVLAAVPLPAPDLDPHARLTALAQAWRQMARRHARLYPWLSLHRWNSATGVAFLGEILRCLVDAGLDEERAARGFRVLGYYMIGATLDETCGYGRGPSSLNSVTAEQLAEREPQVARAGRYFVPEAFDATFELGFELLLRGLGVEVGGGSGRLTPPPGPR